MSGMMSQYFELCKPRVVGLMLVTAWVGMHLATASFVPLDLLTAATLGIACVAGAAAVFNHLLDKHIDRIMQRTQKRPVATGNISPRQAIGFALILLSIGITVLMIFVNTLTAVLSFLTLLGYAVVYTLYLKHATPQNIVIGGVAGAFPPLLGWTAVTNHIDPNSWLLVLIIFVWTPPHFWALAIYRYEEYTKAHIPMLPVTHGIAFTKLSILLYTFLLLPTSILPFVVGMSGPLYAASALLLGFVFCYYAVKLYISDEPIVAMKTFRFSIHYLFLLFVVMLLDHYII